MNRRIRVCTRHIFSTADSRLYARPSSLPHHSRRMQPGGTMIVAIGHGFYLEVPYAEVPVVADKVRAFHGRRREALLDEEAKIKTSIRLVTDGIRELSSHLQ